MLDEAYYKSRYKTAEARILYLIMRKQYGEFRFMAKALGFTQAYFSNLFEKGVPAKYAGYLGRKFDFPGELLCYETYIVLVNGPLAFPSLLGLTKFFNKEDKEYILSGAFVKDVSKYQRKIDKETVK